MSRNICVTAVDGHTGHLIAELLLTAANFKKQFDSVCGLSLHPDVSRCKELENLGAKIIPHMPGKAQKLAKTLEATRCRYQATKMANVPKACFISSVGADLAERDKQPRLRQFIDLECHFMSCKGDPSTSTGYSPVVIRKPVALFSSSEGGGYATIPHWEVEQVCPNGLRRKHGISDARRCQLMVLTGPMLAAEEELATAASQALGAPLKFTQRSDTSEEETKKVLRAQAESDESELEYLLEYYSLVREGKTNYISIMPFKT
ncbi:hypothetical protein ACJ73_05658 [Blastomyces percursus]|uniref:NmrA-like domain-containing protein n=1 Tax=Blastomyces percursus TaxID=1658174 RepID=A0A1J9Q394_9EURO|nr:hypothetical protein ACJ73_05658 [Blastomyces percursus]